MGGGFGERVGVEIGFLVFYEICFFFKKVFFDIFMFICFNLGSVLWKMYEEYVVFGNVLYMIEE